MERDWERLATFLLLRRSSKSHLWYCFQGCSKPFPAPHANIILLMANTQITFEQFLDAELPDGGWKRDFSDTHFVERYLRGYLILSRMQQTEITKIAGTMEKQQKKTSKQTTQLTTEIRKLNIILIDLIRKQEQLDLDFRALRQRNESVLKTHYNQPLDADTKSNGD